MHVQILKRAEGVTNVTGELSAFSYQPSAKNATATALCLADG
jgi:hypothetical protein